MASKKEERERMSNEKDKDNTVVDFTVHQGGKDDEELTYVFEPEEDLEDTNQELCRELLETVKTMNPKALVVIGFDGSDRGFVIDSTKNPLHTSYMTDMAKMMLFSAGHSELID